MISTLTALVIPVSVAVGTPEVTGSMPAVAIAEEMSTLTVVVEGVQEKLGPVYIAVQKRENYQKWNAGAGGVYKGVKAGNHTYTYDLPAGDYAVSIWHDSDNDGQFTMDGYTPLDGWGNSGNQNLQRAPTFDDVKITVTGAGSKETIKMHYSAE
jgi:uncharacterized protein (DUF2141 family)